MMLDKDNFIAAIRAKIEGSIPSIQEQWTHQGGIKTRHIK